jgi:hypothetical protein
MARPSQPEDTLRGPDPRYPSPGFPPAKDTELPFNLKMAEPRTQEDFGKWITAYGSKEQSNSEDRRCLCPG